MQDSIEWVSQSSYVKNLGINFYHFLPTHLSTILLRKHGLISKSTSKRYYQVAILFSRLFCLILVSIDYSILSLKQYTMTTNTFLEINLTLIDVLTFYFNLLYKDGLKQRMKQLQIIFNKFNKLSIQNSINWLFSRFNSLKFT